MSVPAHPARRLILRRSIRQLPIVAITAIALAAAALPAVAAGQSARPGGGDARAKDLRADWGNYDARSDLTAKKALAAKSAQLRAHRTRVCVHCVGNWAPRPSSTSIR